MSVPQTLNALNYGRCSFFYKCPSKCSGMWATVYNISREGKQCGSLEILSFRCQNKISHGPIRGEFKAKANGQRQEVFLKWWILEGYDPWFCQLLTFPLATLDSGSRWGTLCSNSCLPAFQDIRRATGEAAQIMLQMLLFLPSLSLFLSVTSLPECFARGQSIQMNLLQAFF